MDRSTWMYGKRNSVEYLRGIDEFMECATEDMRLRGARNLLCPCRDCQNLQRHRDVQEVIDHLICRGLIEGYTWWVLHGEHPEESLNAGTSINVSYSKTSVNELGAENIENLDSGTNVRDELVGENVEITENVSPQCIDNLDEMMNDITANFVDDIFKIFEKLSKESNISLFLVCTKFMKISAIFKLYNLKAKNNWSDKSFTSLFKLLGEMLPENNELSVSTYKAKKLLCPLSMEVERIPACLNDCILFRKEYKDMDKCPKCNASRYKSMDDQIKEGRKRPAAKVLWYLSVIPRFQRLFANSKDAKLLRWHAEGKKNNEMLRHPTHPNGET